MARRSWDAATDVTDGVGCASRPANVFTVSRLRQFFDGRLRTFDGRFLADRDSSAAAAADAALFREELSFSDRVSAELPISMSRL